MSIDAASRGDSLDRAPRIDNENPWPGLGAFDEEAQNFFNGRTQESAELRRLVSSAPLTVVFGASGLGKTSLLRAGLFPLLRRDDVLPVYVRLDVQSRSAPIIHQLEDAMQAQFRAHQVDAPPFGDGESLWEWLHRETLEIWSRRNRLLTPLFVLDQFEEVFTLGAANADAVARFRVDLADVIENRIPDSVSERIRANDAAASKLAHSSCRYKVLLSFREDFLPAVEGWKRDIPSIMSNRLRLLPMSAKQAFQAVHDTAPHLADEPIALEIVRFVAARGDAVADVQIDDVEDSGARVDPALLSLVCRGLNERRKEAGKPVFDLALLRGTGPEIVSDYYRSAIADLSPQTRRFIEEELITERGFRKPCDLDDARTLHGVPERELQTLVARRLLRIEPQQQTTWVELTHDLLTAVVREHRDRERASARLRKHWRRVGVAAAGVAALLGLVVFGAYRIWVAESSLAESRALLDEFEDRLVASQEQLLESQARLADAQAQLVQSQQEVEEFRRRINDEEAKNDASRQQIEDALETLRTSLPAPPGGSSPASQRFYQTISTVRSELVPTPSAAATTAEALRALVQQTNDQSTEVRRSATDRLIREQSASPTAVRAVLDTLSDENLPSLSAAGRINALYFLSRADDRAWTDENETLAREAIARIRGRAERGVAIGSQTEAELARLEQRVSR